MSMLVSPARFGGGGGGGGPFTTLGTGLVAWWDLEEASGTRVDAVGSYSLTPTGTMTNAAGLTGNGSVSAGSGSYLQRTATLPNFTTGDFTVAGVFKTAISNFGIIGVQDNSGTSGRQWIVLVEGGVFKFVVSTTGTSSTTILATGSGYNNSALHTYICWRDTAANLLCLSVDGGATVSTALTGSTALYSTITALTLHGLGGSAIYNDAGLCDATALWGRMLTSTERTALYNGGAWRSYATL